MNNHAKDIIARGEAVLGIELGSTRIKAVLIDKNNQPIASGSHTWENRLIDGVWTYHLDEVWTGLQDAYARLVSDVREQYGLAIEKLAAIGISAMMHGYLVFDQNNKQLVPFRTWRNTFTEEAAAKLTELFQFNIPLRWNVAHLYQSVLNKESHVPEVRYLTTLAGYVHWRLTGQRVLGIGDASGVFPIDSNINDYDAKMLAQFEELISDKGFEWKFRDILPKVLVAGQSAGSLTAEGAKLLDSAGVLLSGIPMCPPEGDAGTGMVATNSVTERTGNVSAGTSIFSMIVLEKALSKVYTEIDMVTTPSGRPVAMVHCNNCTGDLDSWVNIFAEALGALGVQTEKWKLYDMLYNEALKADADCGGVIQYNYISGEPITGFEEGRPLLVRMENARFTLGNFMRSAIFSAMAALRIGMDILTEKEGVSVDMLYGHGGLFKTKEVGQRLLAGALKTSVAVMESAGEGGAWGIAILAAFCAYGKESETLDSFLQTKVFSQNEGQIISPAESDIAGFDRFMENYKNGLAVQRAAVEKL